MIPRRARPYAGHPQLLWYAKHVSVLLKRRFGMSAIHRPRVYVRGVLVVAAVAVVGVTSAQSKSPSPIDGRDPACSARVAELESEVRALRDLLHLASTTPNPPPSLDTSTRRFSAPRELTAVKQTDACNPPFRYDQQGIKYYRPECLVSEESPVCTIPYGFTSNGSKYYKPDCLEAKPTLPSCDPPYRFDSRGLKSYKPECL